MAKFIKRASSLLIGVAATLQAAVAAQGPGVGKGTATVTDQILLGVGVVAALLTAVVLARRRRS